MGFKVDELFGFIALGDDGDEGVMAINTPTGWLPMVGADMKRVESLKPIAQEITLQKGIKYKIKRFKLIGEIE